MRVANHITTAMLVFGVLGGSRAVAQTIELPDNTVEGFGAHRLENEYKLLVPDNQVAPLVAYLQKRYGRPAILLPDSKVALHGKFSDEFFRDVYFDTPSQQLLHMKSGVRHRSRAIPGQPQNRKDGRQLMQIKLNVPGEELTRAEVKYPIKYYTEAKTQEDRHPVLGIIDRDFRPDFTAQLRQAGIDPWKLRPALTLEQRRRRMYLSDEVGPFATITVDETSSHKLWLSSKFTEVELELNEIRYSSASEAERAEMQRVTDAIKADVLAALPGIEQDQTPKYNKAYARLAGSSSLGPLALRMSVLDMRMVGSLAGLGLFGVWMIVMLLMRRRRNRRMHPATAGQRKKELERVS